MEDIKQYKEIMEFELVNIISEAIETHIKENNAVDFGHLGLPSRRQLFKSHIKNRIKRHYNKSPLSSVDNDSHNELLEKISSSTEEIIDNKKESVNSQELIQNIFNKIDEFKK